MDILGNILIALGVIFMAFGVVGTFMFKSFYLRLLVTSKIDTVGALTLIFGLVIIHGISFFSAKLLLLAVIILILNPLVAHSVARAAYLSRHPVENVESRSKIDATEDTVTD